MSLIAESKAIVALTITANLRHVKAQCFRRRAECFRKKDGTRANRLAAADKPAPAPGLEPRRSLIVRRNCSNRPSEHQRP